MLLVIVFGSLQGSPQSIVNDEGSCQHIRGLSVPTQQLGLLRVEAMESNQDLLRHV